MATGSNPPHLPLWVNIIRVISLVWGTLTLLLEAGIIVASLFGNPGFNDVALYIGVASFVLMLVYLITPAYREVERMELRRMAPSVGGSRIGRFDFQLATIARARMRGMRITFVLSTAGSVAFALYGVLLLSNRHFSGWLGWDTGWWGAACFGLAVLIFLLPFIVYNALMTRERMLRRIAAMKAQGVEIIDRPLQLPADDRAVE